jgi:hypothetical protein
MKENPIEIKDQSSLIIHGKDLISAYAVYVVIIMDIKAHRKYIYVGQTGDAKHLSARSSFYRMAAHLGYSKSTQNQIYRGLVKVNEFSSNNIENESNRIYREKMELWLADKDIISHRFKLADFEFLEDNVPRSHKNYQTHTSKRRQTLKVETALLQKLKNIQSSKLILLNESLMTFKQHKEGNHVANQIINLLKLDDLEY